MLDGIMVLVLIVSIIACIAIMVWRINMAINEPEKYARLREFDKTNEEAMAKVFNAGGKAASSVGAGAVGVLKLFLK